MRDTVICIIVVAILTNLAYIQEKFCKAEQDCFGVDNVRHTSGYFVFIENFIMAEILRPSDKIKLILYYFNNEPV